MHQNGTSLTAREILPREYGDSRNFLTPHVVTRGKLAPLIAYELSSGAGLEFGSSMFGVSVVRVHKDGSTERDHEASACFSSLERANEHVEHLRAVERSCASAAVASEPAESGR